MNIFKRRQNKQWCDVCWLMTNKSRSLTGTANILEQDNIVMDCNQVAQSWIKQATRAYWVGNTLWCKLVQVQDVPTVCHGACWAPSSRLQNTKDLLNWGLCLDKLGPYCWFWKLFNNFSLTRCVIWLISWDSTLGRQIRFYNYPYSFRTFPENHLKTQFCQVNKKPRKAFLKHVQRLSCFYTRS